MTYPTHRYLRNLYVAAILTTLIGSVATICLGLVQTDILKPLWPRMLVSQVCIILAANLVMFAICSGLSRYFGLRFEALLVAISVLIDALLVGLPASLSLAFVFGGSFLLGLCVYRGSSPPVPFLLATGLAILAAFLTIVARFRINTPVFYAAIAVAPLGLLLVTRVRIQFIATLRGYRDLLVERTSDPTDVVFRIGCCVLCFVLQIHFSYVLLPERYYDALVTHLYVPSFMLAHGKWLFDVNVWAFAHMPLTVDFLYAYFFALSGEFGARLFNYSSFLLICWILYDVLNRLTNRRIAIWAVLLLASTPLTLIETASLFIENTVTVWIFAAGAMLVLAWPRITLPLSACILIMLSAAGMSKLHGMAAAAVIGTTLLIGFARTSPRPLSWCYFGLFSCVAAGVAATPYIHAWVSTGNPVFPYFNALFRSPFWAPVSFVDTRWIGRLSPTLLWDATFNSGNYLEAYNGALGLTFAAFVPLSIVVVAFRYRVQEFLFLFFGLSIFLLVATQVQYLRYFYFSAPFFAVLVGISIACITQITYVRVPLGLAVVGTIALNIYLMPTAGWILPHSDLRAGLSQSARRDLELAQAPERIANNIINAMAGSNARVLYTENPFSGLLQGISFSTTWYSTSLMNDVAQATTTNDIEKLVQKTHADYVVHTSNPTTPLLAAFTQFLQHNAYEVGRAGRLIVYRVAK